MTVTALDGVSGPGRRSLRINFLNNLQQTDVSAVVCVPVGTPAPTVVTSKQGSIGPSRQFTPTALGIGSQYTNTPGATVFVGNDSGNVLGSPNADRLVYTSGAGFDQIYGLLDVVVTSSGLLNLADKTETINSLTMNVGRTIMDPTRTTTLYSGSAHVETGNLGLGP